MRKQTNVSTRIIALAISVLMLATLTACGSDNQYINFLKNGWSGNEPTTEAATEITTEATTVAEVVAAKPYAYAITVTINPQVKIYFNEAGNAVAVDYLNKDAITAFAGYNFAGKNLDSCVKQVVKMAKDAGFLKNKQKVSVDFSEKTVDTVAAKDIVAKAEAAVKAEAKTVGVTVTVKTYVTSDTATNPKDISKLGTQISASGKVEAQVTTAAAGTNKGTAGGSTGGTAGGSTGGAAGGSTGGGTVGGSTGGSAGGSASGVAQKTYTASEALALYKTAANKVKTMTSGVAVTRTREVYTEVGENTVTGILTKPIVSKAFGPKDDKSLKELKSHSDIVDGFVVEGQSYVCALTDADVKSVSTTKSGSNLLITILVKDDTTANQNYSNKAVSSAAVNKLAGTFMSGITMMCKDVRVTATIDANGRLINLNTYMPSYFDKDGEAFGAAIEQWWTISYN